MSMKLKAADIVIVGLGWTGGILAKELADTGLSIVVLERGKPRDTNPDFMETQNARSSSACVPYLVRRFEPMRALIANRPYRS